MHIYSRKSTNKGFGIKGAKTLGGGIRMNRTMRMATRGNGVGEDYYNSASNLEDSSKTLNPEFVKKFQSVKIKNSKPKKYITF